MTKKLYDILLNINPDLAALTVEIEKLVFHSPRAAMQTTRTMAETLARHVAEMESIENKEYSFVDLLLKLKSEGVLTPGADQAFQYVRRNGNVASHDGTRKLLIREALVCWEYQHLILTWYIETYASPNIQVPLYMEPSPSNQKEETETIIGHIKKLMERLGKGQTGGTPTIRSSEAIRTVYYKDRCVEVPYFMRDAFLLPQRFPKSTTFLIRLNGEQQARLMSELPSQLDGLHMYVKRFKEKNDEQFFDELCLFIHEETKRKELLKLHKGETLFFYKEDYIILTEMLAEITITTENFPGQSSLVKALQERGFGKIKDLPKEIVLLGKYPNVGEIALANLFNQLKVISLEFSNLIVQ